MPRPLDVIVLDGNQRAALAITRSLGRKGVKVGVGEESQHSLASCSKYCASSFTYPSPYKFPLQFIDVLKKYTARKGKPVLLPITDVTVCETLKNIGQLDGVFRIPFAGIGKYEIVSDKYNLFTMAGRLGVPVPKTVFPQILESGNSSMNRQGALSLGTPVVVKPARSRILTDNGWINTTVVYADSEMMLGHILDEEPFKSFPFIVQERIEGPAVGIFLMMRDGEILARFAHRRIREKPPSGGVSVLCESIDPPSDALDAATKLLREVDWTGVAMVEFKQDRRDGVHKLIEVNARFWGSLQLAVSCGVDFPYLLYQMALGETVRGPDRYRVGLRSRWELGDLDHLLIRLKKKAAELHLSADAPSRGAVLIRFLADFLGPSVRGEVFRPDDPGPFLFELKEYVRHLAGRS